MKKPKLKNQLGDALLLGGHANNAPQSTIMPMSEMPMVLTLDQLSPNPDNPRTGRNPRYDDIKASIKARGLDTVPKVTRDPEGDDVYVFSDGGNTRYQVLSELWHETGDERFYRIHCLVKPWPGRLQCVIGHLAENDMRGELAFIEKAQGISKARKLFEDKLGKKVTLRELSSLLGEEGFPVHFSSISKMEDALNYLYPHMPNLLDGGMGRGQIEALLLFRSSVIKVGKQFLDDNKNLPVEIFSSVCIQLDSPELFSLDVFRDELIGKLVKENLHPSLNYDRWLFELDPKKHKKGSIDVVDVVDVVDSDGVENNSVVNNTSEVSLGDNTITDNVMMSHIEESIISVPEADISKVDDFQDSTKKSEIKSKNNNSSLLHNEDIESNTSFEDTELEPLVSANDNSTNELSNCNDNKYLSLNELWPISPLLDDIEHIQREVFLNVFSLADSLELAEFISQDNSTVKSSGFNVTMDEQDSASLAVLKLLADPNGEVFKQIKSNVFHAVLVGSDIAPIFDDEQILQLIKIIRLLRRLRELQIKTSGEVMNTDEYI
ncbi:ParB family protein [Xenorhabdus khoisanae]|uniref:ParB family protein n=1 Tax=Xenorhabdus khoisanae TaxID=880157 RepID=UPI00235813D9|nr:ParB family protein [Xenorhabdus khoisanae]MDC9612943.1 ParB family protein [Xenorhabdus khoisanae]